MNEELEQSVYRINWRLIVTLAVIIAIDVMAVYALAVWL